MNLNKINRLIFETIETIAPIETSRVSMFDLDDKYKYPPFFRFRFKNKQKDDKIYEKIKNAIICFEGNLRWKLVTKNESKNFIILPSIVDIDEMDQILFQRENYISLFGEILYKKKIDECIADIPKLAEVISSCR